MQKDGTVPEWSSDALIYPLQMGTSPGVQPIFELRITMTLDLQ